MTTAYLGLPIISVNEEMTCIVESQEGHNSFIHMGSSISQQVAALLAFLEYYHWYHFAVITSLIPGHVEFLSELQYLTTGEGEDHDSSWEICETFELQPYDMGNFSETLQQFKEGDCQIVILFTAHEDAKTIFRTAEHLGLLKHGFIWLVLELSVGGHEAVMNVPKEFPIGLIAVKFSDLQYSIETALEDAVEMYSKKLGWFLKEGRSIEFGNPLGCHATERHSFNKNSRTFFDYLSNDSVTYKNYYFDRHGVVKNPRITLLNLEVDRKWRQVGFWQNGNITLDGVVWLGGNHDPPENLSPHRHMMFTTIVEEPFVFSIPLEEHEIVCKYGIKCIAVNQTSGYCCLGFCMDLLEQLSQDIGFTFDLHVVDDNNYGAPVDGHWNGMIGDIVKHEADGAIGAVRITKERAEVVDFSTPFISTGISVLIRKEDGEIPSTAFLGSFHLTVWLFLLIIAVHVTAFVVFLFEWFSPGGYDRDFDKGRVSKFTIGSSIWLTYGILFNSTVQLNVPRSYTAKFMTNMWACFSLVFVAMYTADLVTHMIQEDSHLPVSGYGDPKLQNPLNYKPPLKFATVTASSVETLIMKSNPGMHEYMKNFGAKTAAQAVKALKAGELDAFIYDSEVLIALAKKDDHCDLITVGDVYASTGYAVAFTKESHWIHRFDGQLLQYKSDGFMEKLSNTWMDSACDTKGGGQKASRQTLGIENLAGVFYVLSAGICVSFAIFIGEHIGRKCCNKTRNCCKGKKQKKSFSVLVQVVAQNLSRVRSKPQLEPECHNLSCLQQMAELRKIKRKIKELERLLGQWSPGALSKLNKTLDDGDPFWTEADETDDLDDAPVQNRGRKNTYAEAIDEEELIPLNFPMLSPLQNNVACLPTNWTENINNTDNKLKQRSFGPSNHIDVKKKQNWRNSRPRRVDNGDVFEQRELIPPNATIDEIDDASLETTV
ncbi:glutamate receptor ionotropic, NMDA 2A-like [Glandiceps talaboti]